MFEEQWYNGDMEKRSKKAKTPFKIVFVRIINALFMIISFINFLLLLATAGAWMSAIENILLKPAVTEPYKISGIGVLYGVIFALLLAIEIMMLQIKGKNAAEIFSLVVNFAFLVFVAVYLTANISAFPFIFCGLGLSFSIIGTMIMLPSDSKH